ncbi:MAG: TolC family protein [Gemmatimonadetes bacterium]|nr:TolC family protein [Gemmatimonadota bacterium]
MVARILGLALQLAASQPVPDSAVVTLAEFRARVAAYHPVARAARASLAAAEQDVRVARGAFDPTLSAEWDRKRYDGKTYYDEVAAELKVPTPVGADVKVAIERTLGANVNPQVVTPSAGLLTVGISIPFGQRMLTDERRAALQAARATRDAADGERASALNRLLLAAVKEYARWYEAVQREKVARDGIALASFRLDAVRRRFQNGEAPAIDTLEARLEVQRREGQLVEARQALVNARIAAAAYLWDEAVRPVELALLAVPALEATAVAVDSARLAGWIAEAERAHPEVTRTGARVRALEAQRGLVAQQVLPLMGLDLALVRAGDDAQKGALEDNYKAGAFLKSPVLFLKERGRLGAVNERLDALRLDLARIRREIGNGARSAANDLTAAERLLALQRSTVVQAELLLAGEQRRFDAGESSLLVVNLRERLLLDEEVRLAQLEARRLAAYAELGVALGLPARLP